MLLFPGKRKRTIKKQTLISPWPFFSHPEDAAAILLYPLTGENQTFSPAFLCVLKSFLSSLQPGLPCIPAVYKLYHWAALSAAFFYCFATQSPPSEFFLFPVGQSAVPLRLLEFQQQLRRLFIGDQYIDILPLDCPINCIHLGR